jgi:hypothetical protein
MTTVAQADRLCTCIRVSMNMEDGNRKRKKEVVEQNMERSY